MVSTPHYTQYTSLRNQDMYPRSPKRKLDDITPTPSKLQTTNLDTLRSRKLSDAAIEDTLSPRAAVSARMQGLHIRGSSSPITREARKASWTPEQGWSAQMIPSFQKLSGDVVPTIDETPEQSASSVEIAESSQGDEKDSLKHDLEQGIFEFKAGGHLVSSDWPHAAVRSPFKRPAFAEDDEDNSMQDITTPSKRQRHRSPSMSPSPSPPIPRSMSPSARRLSHRSPPPSDMSSSPGDAEVAQYWWQPSEIVGHDPEDPEEDHRGVNGIGYQKTKAEQWRISEKKKRQIAEWRSREAKEARSLRAGGRRVIMGRISKPGSRAGSPSDSTAKGRSSPMPRSVSDEKKMEEVVRRAVRFDLG